MNILLTGGGQINDYLQLSNKLLDNYDLVIAVDGGAEHLVKLNIQPNYMIGDFDSISEQTQKIFSNVERVVFPPEKDETDSDLAFDYVTKFNPDIVHAVGFVGSRWDHSMANLMLLVRYADLNLVFINENNRTTLCKKNQIVNRTNGDYLSLIPLTDIKGLNIKGVKYPLTDRDITWPSSLTISNVIIESQADINFDEGKMLLMITRD
jgi:thiamine pyrophosphokinase